MNIKMLQYLIAVSLAPLPLSSAQGQVESKPNPMPPPQTPFVMRSVSHHHAPVPTYLIEADKKANAADIRGKAFLKSGDADAALNSFNEALTHEPEDSQAYLGLAAVYEAKGQLSQAITVYRNLFYHWPGKGWGSSDETKTTNLMKFALVLMKTGRREEALEVYQQGIHFLPTGRGPLPSLFTVPNFTSADFESAAYTAIGIYEMAWGISDDATAYFERAVATQPTSAVPCFYRGLILKRQPGRAADALADLRRAEQLGGPTIKPFVDDALKDGTTEFAQAVKKAQAGATP